MLIVAPSPRAVRSAAPRSSVPPFSAHMSIDPPRESPVIAPEPPLPLAEAVTLSNDKLPFELPAKAVTCPPVPVPPLASTPVPEPPVPLALSTASWMVLTPAVESSGWLATT